MEDDALEVLIQAEQAPLVGVERQVVPLVHLVEVQAEGLGRPPAHGAVPAVRQNQAANVEKQN